MRVLSSTFHEAFSGPATLNSLETRQASVNSSTFKYLSESDTRLTLRIHTHTHTTFPSCQCVRLPCLFYSQANQLLSCSWGLQQLTGNGERGESSWCDAPHCLSVSLSVVLRASLGPWRSSVVTTHSPTRPHTHGHTWSHTATHTHTWSHTHTVAFLYQINFILCMHFFGLLVKVR